MKVTVNITSSLLAEAERRAAIECTTVDALIHEGLVKVLAEHRNQAGFSLRKAAVGGTGITEAASNLDHEDWMRVIYDDRSG